MNTITIQKWDSKEAANLQAIARSLFRCECRGEYPDHCGACALKGYLSESARADGMKCEDGPNYAGWGRVYVEAGKAIPSHWRVAFHLDQLNGDNEAYSNALRRSIATFGVRFA